MKRTLGLTFLLCLLLNACQGSKIDIVPTDEVLSSQKIIDDLRAAKTDEVRERLINDLYGKRGSFVEWAEFWHFLELAQDLHPKIIPKYENQLFGLQSRSCSQSGYTAFASFLISVGRGWNQLLEPKRKCDKALPPGMVMKVFRLNLPAGSAAGQSVESKTAWLSFLRQEMERTPEMGTWENLINTRDRIIFGQIVDSIYRDPATDDAAGARAIELVNFEATMVRLRLPLLAPGLLKDLISTNSVALEQFAKRIGQSQVIAFLDNVANDESRSNLSYDEEKTKLSVETVLRDPFVDFGVNADLVWPHYLSWRGVVDKMTLGWGFAARLRVLSRQQKTMETWLLALPLALRKDFFIPERFQTANGIAALELAWLALRTNEVAPVPLKSEAFQKKLAEAYGNHLDYLVQALGLRLRIHLSPTMGRRHELVGEYCTFLDARRSLPKQIKGAENFQKLIQSEIAPGCFEIETDSKSYFVNTLKMNFDSILIMPFTGLEIHGENLELGILDISEAKNIVHPDTTGNLGDQGAIIKLFSKTRPRAFGCAALGSPPANDPKGTRGIDGDCIWVAK